MPKFQTRLKYFYIMETEKWNRNKRIRMFLF